MEKKKKESQGIVRIQALDPCGVTRHDVSVTSLIVYHPVIKANHAHSSAPQL